VLSLAAMLIACSASDSALTDPDGQLVGAWNAVVRGDVGFEVELPDHARAGVDPLVCHGSAEQVDGWTFTWTVDGESWSGMTLATEHDGDTVFPGYTRPGQVWRCTATALLGGEVVGVGTGEAEIAAGGWEELDTLVAPAAWLEDEQLFYAGPLAGAESLSVTYGVDGWASRNALAGAEFVLYETQETRAQHAAEMTLADGIWSASVELPVGFRVVHMTFSDGTESDDAAGHEYSWEVEFPSVGPFLTWNDRAAPATGIVINWVSGQPGFGVVEYGPDQENVAFASGDVVDTIHHVALTGLPPGRTFSYRVRDAAGRVSEWSTFRTAGVSDDAFTFLVASDMQDTGMMSDRWPAIAAQMAVSAPDARFVLVPGDLTADDFPGLWWLFFDGGRELFNHVPLVPAIGNHDDPGVPSSTDTTSWRYWFDLPAEAGNEVFWRVDYGRTAVFILDSEEVEQTMPGGAQYGWLDSELAEMGSGALPGVDWTVAAYHIPSYNAGARFAGLANTYRPLTQLFDGTMDAVIAGHEHIYQRFEPIQYDGSLASSGDYGPGPDEGVLYLVTPAAGFPYLDTNMAREDQDGAEQLDLLAWPELAESDDDEREGHDERVGIHGFLVADVTPCELTFSFVGMGNSTSPREAEVLDTVTLRK
jgi:hypothetical protein